MDTLAITTPDTEATLALAAELGRALGRACVCGLVVELAGDLGAGKTVFVRGLARALGVAPSLPVVSPTFTIARAYALTAGPLRELHHVDAYRLGGADELEAAGFEEMCGIGRLTCVEWGENVVEALPEDRVRITLLPQLPEDARRGEAPECPRRVRFEALGPLSAALLAELERGLRGEGGA